MNGFLCVLKPPGMTSSDVVVRVRRRLPRGTKVGHAGTLDPEAAGVLPVMVGRGARLLNYFTDKSKRYIAEIAFAGATDTQDAQGTIVEAARCVPERAEIEAVLPRFRGAILQCPPAYSALKRDGVPLYALARRGEMVETKARPTTIDELTLEEPEIMKQGGRYGIRLKASAPSIHMIRADIETAVSPIVGNEKQSEDMVNYLLQEFEGDTRKIWQSNIFGRSFHELVSDDLQTKVKRMPADAQRKLQETLTRIINEGSGGLICIIL